MKKTQMQIMQEAINKLNAMSDDDFLSALIKAGVADAGDAAPSIDESEGGKRGR
ncbi:hypothetical protein HGO23_06630 [Xenorhabdus budapestensis]|uniref:Transposase n=1 Tax=Xenorhabdus budapestensis TaxID=290110 RepID=A0ABX7VFS8_XENBU|nr:hypothetical protein [Xenorhabdus budapestensis]QTL38791.1 hypothetical protein HGO23_12995 [Xenorhabdus budapestensis]QTL41007.1 hypothetical protein HGO23_06630 [Xenorhabdus budapestensis]